MEWKIVRWWIGQPSQIRIEDHFLIQETWRHSPILPSLVLWRFWSYHNTRLTSVFTMSQTSNAVIPIAYTKMKIGRLSFELRSVNSFKNKFQTSWINYTTVLQGSFTIILQWKLGLYRETVWPWHMCTSALLVSQNRTEHVELKQYCFPIII